MPTYVQKPGGDTWHWCPNTCPNYPSSPTNHTNLSGKDRPSSGELCNICKDREQDGNCS